MRMRKGMGETMKKMHPYIQTVLMFVGMGFIFKMNYVYPAPMVVQYILFAMVAVAFYQNIRDLAKEWKRNPLVERIIENELHDSMERIHLKIQECTKEIEIYRRALTLAVKYINGAARNNSVPVQRQPKFFVEHAREEIPEVEDDEV